MLIINKHSGTLPVLFTKSAATVKAVGFTDAEASAKFYCMVTKAHRRKQRAQGYCTLVTASNSLNRLNHVNSLTT